MDLSFDGVRVLDLFAGTGALGFEALSRGAAFALFVDTEADARALIRENIERTATGGVTKVFRRDAMSLGPAGTISAFDLCFLDPPYGMGSGEKALASAHAGGWLRDDAHCVLERRLPGRKLKFPSTLTYGINAGPAIQMSIFCIPPQLKKIRQSGVMKIRDEGDFEKNIFCRSPSSEGKCPSYIYFTRHTLITCPLRKTGPVLQGRFLVLKRLALGRVISPRLEPIMQETFLTVEFLPTTKV